MIKNSKAILIGLLALMCWIDISNAQNVTIPDTNFKAALVSNLNINTNGDGEIQVTEASTYTGVIKVNGLAIADLTGIQAFPSIRALYCSDNQLTSLDVSTNLALDSLDCTSNDLTFLDVPATTNLTYLYCSFNDLSNLDVSGNTALTRLSCGFNNLTSLDVSANTNLTDLICSFNQLSSLNVSSNPLTFLTCEANQLTSLDVSANTNLSYLICNYNRLTSLSILTNTALFYLDCYGNKLTSLDVSTNALLKFLKCYDNQLTSLDVSANTVLRSLDCSSNKLQSLNVKNGNNLMFSLFATNNPDLTCIQVDDAAYSDANWASRKDPAAFYSENCATNINENYSESDFSIFPNPSNSSTPIYYSLNNSQKVSIEVYNSLGEKVSEMIKERQNPGKYEYNFSPAQAGVYFVKLKVNEQVEMKKVIFIN